MAHDVFCHRHKAQEVAYFLRFNKPMTKAEVVADLAEKALANWDFEDSDFDAEAGTLTVKDWAGATFVLTLTKHIKAEPFKARLAKALAHSSPAAGWGV